MAKHGKVTFNNTQVETIRPVRKRKYKQLMLIVCEDQTTEPTYFRQFKPQIPDDTLFLHEIGTGLSPLGVVQRAIVERLVLTQEAGKEVDFTWAVFDRDDHHRNPTTAASFVTAYELAAKENIRIALSNEVFELWLLLHLIEVDPAVPLPRATIYTMLQDQIRLQTNNPTYIYDHYHGAAAVIPIINQIGEEPAAIERGERLAQHFAGIPPILSDPSTDIYILVQQLRQLIEFYSYQG